ncbi:MAG: hypothetical protein Q4A58_03955 [Fusobacterium sp.]|uniref:hypothetical protein n=1 Tax=Fusobacterium sp. TaxID=68766 RepID=UPI0026DC59F8|nr:hypothetical protein [Fusobacterium sp.]MDO4690432.1 hypothetical protein [Fusobacterium sp.]
MERTIYIITTPEKILLRAFTSKNEALAALETEYKKVERECYLEPCALFIDSDFIQEIKKI